MSLAHLSTRSASPRTKSTLQYCRSLSLSAEKGRQFGSVQREDDCPNGLSTLVNGWRPHLVDEGSAEPSREKAPCTGQFARENLTSRSIGRPSTASRFSCKVAALSGPTRRASTKHWRRPTSAPIGLLARQSAQSIPQSLPALLEKSASANYASSGSWSAALPSVSTLTCYQEAMPRGASRDKRAPSRLLWSACPAFMCRGFRVPCFSRRVRSRR